jgi:hypothetical protein
MKQWVTKWWVSDVQFNRNIFHNTWLLIQVAGVSRKAWMRSSRMFTNLLWHLSKHSLISTLRAQLVGSHYKWAKKSRCEIPRPELLRRRIFNQPHRLQEPLFLLDWQNSFRATSYGLHIESFGKTRAFITLCLQLVIKYRGSKMGVLLAGCGIVAVAVKRSGVRQPQMLTMAKSVRISLSSSSCKQLT